MISLRDNPHLEEIGSKRGFTAQCIIQGLLGYGVCALLKVGSESRGGIFGSLLRKGPVGG